MFKKILFEFATTYHKYTYKCQRWTDFTCAHSFNLCMVDPAFCVNQRWQHTVDGGQQQYLSLQPAHRIVIICWVETEWQETWLVSFSISLVFPDSIWAFLRPCWWMHDLCVCVSTILQTIFQNRFFHVSHGLGSIFAGNCHDYRHLVGNPWVKGVDDPTHPSPLPRWEEDGPDAPSAPQLAAFDELLAVEWRVVSHWNDDSHHLKHYWILMDLLMDVDGFVDGFWWILIDSMDGWKPFVKSYEQRQPGLKALALWQSVEDVITWWRSQMQALDIAHVVLCWTLVLSTW